MSEADRRNSAPYLIFHSPELPNADALDLAVDALDEVERGQASRYRLIYARRRFIWRRYLRRHLLAEALGVEPGELVFATACPRCGSQAHGKPYLPDAPHLHFSAAQSGDQAVVAIGPASLGIDIQTRSAELLDAAGVFTPGELAELGGRLHERPCGKFVMLRSALQKRVSKHVEHLRRAVLWARKEAYLKALGLGLSIDPASVDARASGFADGVFGEIAAPGQTPWSVASWTLADAVVAIACVSPQAVRCTGIAAAADPKTGRLAVSRTSGHEDETGTIYASSGAGGEADLSQGR